MSTPVVWGTLPKAQDDSTTIDAAVAAAIAAHNEDPTAHMDTGQSIDVHRTNTTIDHPAGSVQTDKFSRGVFVSTSFESLDAWLTAFTGSAGKTLSLSSVQLFTGATSSSVAVLWTVPVTFPGYTVDQDYQWRATLNLVDKTNCVAYWGTGYLEDGIDQDGAGFRVVSGTLRAFGADSGTITDIVLSGINPQDVHTYELHYFHDTNTLEFWVDGVQVGSMTSGFSVLNEDELAVFYIKNTTASGRYMYLQNFMFSRPL